MMLPHDITLPDWAPNYRRSASRGQTLGSKVGIDTKRGGIGLWGLCNGWGQQNEKKKMKIKIISHLSARVHELPLTKDFQYRSAAFNDTQEDIKLEGRAVPDVAWGLVTLTISLIP